MNNKNTLSLVVPFFLFLFFFFEKIIFLHGVVFYIMYIYLLSHFKSLNLWNINLCISQNFRSAEELIEEDETIKVEDSKWFHQIQERLSTLSSSVEVLLRKSDNDSRQLSVSLSQGTLDLTNAFFLLACLLKDECDTSLSSIFWISRS